MPLRLILLQLHTFVKNDEAWRQPTRDQAYEAVVVKPEDLSKRTVRRLGPAS